MKASSTSIRPWILSSAFLKAAVELEQLGECRAYNLSLSGANADLMADTISVLEWPAITILVRRSAIGTIDRAARRVRHSAPLTLGFQNSGESNAAIQLLSTIQPNPFFPRTAVS
jgi:hypothetical protein